MKQPLVQFLMAWLLVAFILDYKFIQHAEVESESEEKTSKEGSEENEPPQKQAVEKPRKMEARNRR